MSRSGSRTIMGLALASLPPCAALGCQTQTHAVTMADPARLVVTQDDQGFKIIPVTERGAPCCASSRQVPLGVGLKLDAAIFERSNAKSGRDANAPRR